METESYLGLNKDKIDMKNQNDTIMCHFCATNKIELLGNVLHQCSNCQRVAYCDRQCQAWDKDANQKSNKIREKNREIQDKT